MNEAIHLLKKAEDYHAEILGILGSILIDLPYTSELSIIFIELGKYVIQKIKQQPAPLSPEIIENVAEIKRWSTTERKGDGFVCDEDRSLEDYFSQIESRFNVLFSVEEEGFIDMVTKIVKVFLQENSFHGFIDDLDKKDNKNKAVYAARIFNQIDFQLKVKELQNMFDESKFPEQKIAVSIFKCLLNMGLLDSSKEKTLQALYKSCKGKKAWHEANILALQVLLILLTPILDAYSDKSMMIKDWNKSVITMYSDFCVNDSIPEVETLYKLMSENFWETSKNQKTMQNYLDIFSELKSIALNILSGPHQEEFIKELMEQIISKIESCKEIINANYSQIHELGGFLKLLQNAIPDNASEIHVKLSAMNKELEGEINKADKQINIYLDDLFVRAKEINQSFIKDLDFFDSTFETPNSDHQQDYQRLIAHYENYLSILDDLSKKVTSLDTNNFFDTAKKLFGEVNHILNQDQDSHLVRVFNIYRNYLYEKFQNIENNSKDRLSDIASKMEVLKSNVHKALFMMRKYSERKLSEKNALTITPALEEGSESRKRARYSESQTEGRARKQQKITDFFHPKPKEEVVSKDPIRKVPTNSKDDTTEEASSQLSSSFMEF